MFYYLLLPFVAQSYCSKLGQIINGVDEHEISNDTSFVVSINFEGKHICAGAIIHRKYVLTAAHCFLPNFDKSSIKVRYGLNKLYDDPKIYSIGINRTIIHPKYHVFDGIFDIAIIELETSFPPMPNWRPIMLYQQLPDSYPLTGRVYGWGQTSKNATSYSRVLKHLTVEIYPDSLCTEESFSYLFLCVGTSNGGLCFGDDGDPLIIDYKLAGISSILTNPCSSDTGTPELSLSFSRVDTYFDWILEYVDLEGEDYFEEYFQYL